MQLRSIYSQENRAIEEIYLCSEHIQSKAIETAYHSLLNVQTKVVQSPHSGQQETWSTGTEHVYVHSPPFSQPYFDLYNSLITEQLEECHKGNPKSV